MRASITSKSDSKVFELSDKFQRCAIVASYVKVGIAEVFQLNKTMAFALSVLSLSPLRLI